MANVLPEIGLDTSSVTRPLAVRDRTNGAMVPLAYLDTVAHRWAMASTVDAGAMTVTETGGTQKSVPDAIGAKALKGANADITSISGLAGQVKSTIPALVTTQTTTGGSVGQGTVNLDTKRTGGFGQYANFLTGYTVSAATPSGQFDCGLTSWATHQNLTGGQLFAGWYGANTPSSGNDYGGNPLSQTYSGGAAIGLEVNVGNRWADFGLQYNRGARFTVGLQVVPDPIPAADGPTATVYPGTFGTLYAQGQNGHRWWTAEYIAYETIQPGGLAYLVSGGSNAGNAPLAAFTTQGFFNKGIDFALSTFAGNQITGPGWSVSSAGKVAGTGLAAGASTITGIGAANIAIGSDAAAVTKGLFADASNMALVATSSGGGVYVQGPSGVGNWGLFTATSFTVIGGLTASPPASATPANNGQMTFELTNNTTLKIKVKGSDGTVRSATLTLT